MTRERFAEILKEYGYTDHQVELLWRARPVADVDEARLRDTARFFQHIKDDMVQE